MSEYLHFDFLQEFVLKRNRTSSPVRPTFGGGSTVSSMSDHLSHVLTELRPRLTTKAQRTSTGPARAPYNVPTGKDCGALNGSWQRPSELFLLGKASHTIIYAHCIAVVGTGCTGCTFEGRSAADVRRPNGGC